MFLLVLAILILDRDWEGLPLPPSNERRSRSPVLVLLCQIAKIRRHVVELSNFAASIANRSYLRAESNEAELVDINS
jgi:hypothetical protein